MSSLWLRHNNDVFFIVGLFEFVLLELIVEEERNATTLIVVAHRFFDLAEDDDVHVVDDAFRGDSAIVGSDDGVDDDVGDDFEDF